MKCSEAPLGQVQVWDRFIRLFHWSLVALIPLAFFSHGGLRDLHRWTGYAILFLIAARVIWGFYGDQRARFANFVPNPVGVVHNLWQLMRRKEPRTLGHNPARGDGHGFAAQSAWYCGYRAVVGHHPLP